MRHLQLLRSDDPHSGVVSRTDVIGIVKVALSITDTHPEDARALLEISRRVRATIPLHHWPELDVEGVVQHA